MVFNRRFIWTLSLMLYANGISPGSESEPEDSYLWLEEVTGVNSLAWVKERNSESVTELTRSPEFRALTSNSGDAGFGGPDSGRSEAGAALL